MWFIGKSYTQFGFDIISSLHGMAHYFMLLPRTLGNVSGMNIVIISPTWVIRRTGGFTRGNGQADLLTLGFSIVWGHCAVSRTDGSCCRLGREEQKGKQGCEGCVCGDSSVKPSHRCIWLASGLVEQETGPKGGSQRLLSGCGIALPSVFKRLQLFKISSL